MSSQQDHGFNLSPQQRCISALMRGDYARSPLRVSGALQIDGSLDAAELRGLFQEVVRHNEILRTRFGEAGEGALLQIVDDLEPYWRMSDWRSRPADQLCTAIEETLQSGFNCAIDCRRGPVMHVHLARIPTGWLAFVVLPALCSDALSISNLAKHLAIAQRASSTAFEVGQPALQYADVAEWILSEEATRPTASGWLDHWPKRGAKAAKPRTRFQPQFATRPLPAAIQLQDERHHQTLLAAWANLLCRRFQERQGTIPLVIQSDGRTLPELANALGPFTNYLPILLEVNPLRAFGEWAADFGRQLEEIRWRDQPFRWSSENGASSESLPPAWAFTIADRSAIAAADGIRVSVLREIALAAEFDLSLECVRRPCGCQLELTYNGTLSSSQQALDILDAYAADLTRFTSDPGLLLRHSCALSEHERQRIIAHSSGETVPLRSPGLLHEPFQVQAKQSPSAVALEFNSLSLTYEQVDRHANRIACMLQQFGTGPEEVIAVWGECSLELPVGMLAILKAGGAFLALDPELPQARLAAIAEDARPRLFLVGRGQLSRIPKLPCEIVTISVDDVDDLSHSSTPPTTAVSTDHLAYVTYTSGSAGEPKGVLVTHGTVCNQMHWMQKHWPLRESDCTLLKRACGFDRCLWEIFWPLMNGARVLIADPQGHRDPAYLCRLIAQKNVTSTFFVPSMLMNMLADPGIRNVTGFRTILCGGEIVSMEICGKFHATVNGELLHLYGPAEAGMAVYGCILPRGGSNAFAPLGAPVANSRVYLLDEFLELVPDGAIGEICISGTALSRGYLNLPARTANSFLPDPYAEQPGARLYRTGDLARRYSDGSIEFVGRADSQIKIPGSRIDLSDLEYHLNALPSVAYGAVVAQKNGAGDKKLVGYVVSRSEERDGAALQRRLQERLPACAFPTEIRFIDEMPLNANGKPDRARLSALAGAGDLHTAPASQHSLSEQYLLKTWREVLEIEEIGVTDDFFALGGHSLVAARVAARIQRDLQATVPVGTMLDLKTAATLAPVIEYHISADLIGITNTTTEETVHAYVADNNRSRLDLTSLLTAAQREQINGRFARALQGPCPGAIPRLGLCKCPLSSAQKRMWFLERLSPRTSRFNVPIAVRISGVLLIDRLSRALDRVVQRHEVLRTRFCEREGEPFQLVAASVHVPLVIEDCTTPDDFDRKLHEEAWLPFDLQRDPPIRAMMLRQSSSECLLLLTLHHIVCDDWSIGVLIKDLLAFYQEREEDLPPLAIQYSDYSEWQRHQLAAAEIVKQLAYWRERLRNLPGTLELPLNGALLAPNESAGLRPVGVDRELAAELEQFARAHQSTLFMVLLTALDALLYCLSEQTDLVVGVPLANRGRVETEHLIGLFINPVMIRTEVRPDLCFEELLERVRQAVTEAYQNQDAPFDAVLNALDDRSARNPFRVWFSLQNAPAPDLLLPDLQLEPLVLEPKVAKFDLALLLAQKSLSGFFEYRKDLFAGNIDAIVGFWERMLREVLAAPYTRMCELHQRWREHADECASAAVSDFRAAARQSFQQFRAAAGTRGARGDLA
jgi:amino acid adenylation domain-containing protein